MAELSVAPLVALMVEKMVHKWVDLMAEKLVD